MSDATDDDKKKLAEHIERFGDQHRDMMVRGIQQILRTFADGVSKIAAQYEHDAWAAVWVDLAKRAVADLRLAETHVEIQPLAPHGKVPS